MARYRNDAEITLSGHIAALEKRVANLESVNTITSGSSLNARSDSVSTPESTGSSNYIDLATVGPVISNVFIGGSGKCLVVLTTKIETTNNGGSMSFEITGVNTFPASNGRQLAVESTTSMISMSTDLTASTTILMDNLTSGNYTFTAKYAATAGGIVKFSNRSMIVIPL